MNFIVKKNYISKLSIFLAVLIAIFSAQPWFIWNSNILTLCVCAIFLISRTLLFKVVAPRYIVYSIGTCFLMYIYLFWFHAVRLDDIFSTVFTKFLPLIFILLFSKEEKGLFIQYLTKTLSFILLISLVFFLLWALGFNLPSSTISHSASFYVRPFTNYFAFVIIDNPEYTLLTRFQSIFTEPGHLGMIVALLLYANHYNLKDKKVWILLLSLLWSLSLAAYILLFIGIALYILGKSINFRKSFLLLLIFMAAVVITGAVIYRVNEDSVISKLIISRIEYDEVGGISGNNRNTADFINRYNDFLDSPDAYLGIGLKRFAEIDTAGGNSSYKCFIMQYGYVGILVLLGFVISIIYPRNNRLYWGFFILYLSSFIQRPYFLWEFESFLFISYLGINNNK